MKPCRPETSLQDKRVELWTPWGVLRLSAAERAQRERLAKDRSERLPPNWVRPSAQQTWEWDGEPLN